MEDGDTEKYHPSRVIQDCVFLSRKEVVPGVFHCRLIIIHYIIVSKTIVTADQQQSQKNISRHQCCKASVNLTKLYFDNL